MRGRKYLAARRMTVGSTLASLTAVWLWAFLVSAVVLPAAPALAQSTDTQWNKLSELSVGSGLETGTIDIGRDAGLFERVRLAASGTDVLVHEMRVYFADGDMQRLASLARVTDNQQTEPFELEGGLRHIDRIELTFEGRSPRRGQSARVSVWGEAVGATDIQSARGGQWHEESGLGGDWELLGKELVGSKISHNVIPIGRHEGRFDALRLRVLRSDVAFHDIRVIYLNGDADTLAVRKLVRAGDASPPLNLTGEARYIREVELVHEANPDMRGRAVVQVWARRQSR